MREAKFHQIHNVVSSIGDDLCKFGTETLAHGAIMFNAANEACGETKTERCFSEHIRMLTTAGNIMQAFGFNLNILLAKLAVGEDARKEVASRIDFSLQQIAERKAILESRFAAGETVELEPADEQAAPRSEADIVDLLKKMFGGQVEVVNLTREEAQALAAGSTDEDTDEVVTELPPGTDEDESKS